MGKTGKNRHWKRGLALMMAVLMGVMALTGCQASQMEYGVERLTPKPKEVVSKERTVKLTEEETEAIASFSMEFMRLSVTQAHEKGIENPVLSPVSVYLAMLLTACGSAGDSEEEFEQLLGILPEQWPRYGERLMQYMNWSSGATQVRAANSVWLDEGSQIREDYLKLAAESLQSEIFRADLSAKETVKAVNRWVNDRTEGMIPKFRSDPYQDTVVLALLNAVYMEALWSDEFQAKQTTVKTFTAQDGREIQTEFLCDFECDRKYVKQEELEAVLLPYSDGKLAFLVLKGTQGQNVEELLNELTVQRIKELSDQAVNTYMNFSMPGFTLGYEQDLTEVMRQMGLLQTMDPEKADLSATGTGAGGEALYVSGVGQTVKIQVDEAGTKAAAVTEVTAAECSVDRGTPLELHFDSPYVYAVIDLDTGLPLFMGVMECPQEAQ